MRRSSSWHTPQDDTKFENEVQLLTGTMDANTLLYILMAVTAMVMSSTVHEWAHAFVAMKLGDDTPLKQGRVTLNPGAHIDPIGTLAMPAIGAAIGGFLIGWARPVQFRPSGFRRTIDMRQGSMYVALAGPLSNIALVFVCLGLLKAGTLAVGVETVAASATMRGLAQLLVTGAWVNVILAFFNLMPVPPLDGFRILEAYLPADSKVLEVMREYQLLFFIGAIFIGFRLMQVPMLALFRFAIDITNSGAEFQAFSLM